MLGVALAEVNLTAEVGGALPGDGQHRGAELDAGDTGIGRIVGQAAAGADGDFEDPAAGAGAEPFLPAGELDFLEEGDLLVVAARGLVPDLLLPCGRGRACPCLGGTGHDAGPCWAGEGEEQSTWEVTAALMTPMTACRTRAAAWPRPR